MSVSKPAPLVAHGWTVFAHPLFVAQLEDLTRQVEVLKQKDPVGYVRKNASKRLGVCAAEGGDSERWPQRGQFLPDLKLHSSAMGRKGGEKWTAAAALQPPILLPRRLLAAITKLAFDVIPQDPTRPEYRQGNSLGGDHKHWFRAKFFQQYRLFFRYHAPSKVLVFAWVNDDDTKRAYESSDDAYRVFRKMLAAGHPPDDWTQLLAQALNLDSAVDRSPPPRRPHVY